MSALLQASDWDTLLHVNPSNAAAGGTVQLKSYSWHVVDTEHFRLHYMTGVHPEHVRQVAERVDNIWRFLKLRSGVECDSRILVFLPLNRSTYNKLTSPFVSRRRSGRFPAAQDFVSKSVIAIDTHDYVDRLASIMYESTHLFRHTREAQHRKDSGPWCWWSGEFMARYFSMGLMRVFAVLRPRRELCSMWFRDRVLPRWSALETMKPGSVHPRSRRFEFTVVESALHFLELTYGQERMAQFWRATLDASSERYASTEAIFKEVFGKGFDELEREWCDYYAVGLPAWYISAAHHAYSKGDLPRAAAFATGVLDAAPRSALRNVLWKRAWGLAGACFRKAGLREEAESHFEAAAMIPYRWCLGADLDPFGNQYSGRRSHPSPNDPQRLPEDEPSLAALAAHHQRRGETNLAIHAYEELAKRFPNSSGAPTYHFTLGQLLMRKGQKAEALQAWTGATRYPNSYQAMRGHMYIGRHKAQLPAPEAKAEARRHFQAVLNTNPQGQDSQRADSLRRWARRELAKLDKNRPVTVRATPAKPTAAGARVVTHPRAHATLADRMSAALAVSPAQRTQIAGLVEKCRSLQMSTWRSLARAGAERDMWLAVQSHLLAARRREIEDILDDAQKDSLSSWFIERLAVSDVAEPMPRDENQYNECRAHLTRWAESWRQTRLNEFAAQTGLDPQAADALKAMLGKYRKDVLALWAQVLKGRGIAEIGKGQSALDKALHANAAKLLGPARAALFHRWWQDQKDELEQYNGVIRHPPQPTQDDL